MEASIDGKNWIVVNGIPDDVVYIRTCPDHIIDVRHGKGNYKYISVGVAELPPPNPCNKCSCHVTGGECDKKLCCDYSPNCPY